MKLTERYQRISAILDRLDFHALYDGFRRYRFALYTSQEVCLNGQRLPYQPEFIGNTAIQYQGEFIAIWNVESDPTDDEERLAASIVHEMFHCHQFTGGEMRFPSDLTILAHPDTLEGFAMQHRENLCLADAFERNDQNQFRQFAAIRRVRRRANPALTEEELKTETIEGIAEAVGMKALRSLNTEKYRRVVDRYLEILRAADERLLNARRMAYHTGAIWFLYMEQQEIPIVNDFRSVQTAYDQNIMDGSTAEKADDVKPDQWLMLVYREQREKQQAKITSLLARHTMHSCNAEICGYDPMNQFRIGDLLYCSHFVRLREKEETWQLFSEVVLKMAPGAENHVLGYAAAPDARS